jgi:hypothetical protein
MYFVEAARCSQENRYGLTSDRPGTVPRGPHVCFSFQPISLAVERVERTAQYGLRLTALPS